MRLALVVAAPLAALAFTPALADKDTSAAQSPTVAQEIAKPTEKPAEQKAEMAEAKPEEAKRICRRIRTDASSRRKVKVCMTADEWREANQAR